VSLPSALRQPLAIPACLAIATLVSACAATPSAPAPRVSTSPSTAATPTATPAPTATSPTTPTPIVTPGSAPPAIALAPVAEGLREPIGITPASADVLLVNEQGGRLVAVRTDGSQSVVLDLAGQISAGGERGLLGVALHPGWPDEGRAFLHYSDPAGDTVISEFTASDPAAPALDAASERVLLTLDQPYPNHNGGQLAFGPDGYLYVALGDGGSGGDPNGNGQNTNALLGKILRLDIDAAHPYGIPADNPFADGGGAPEVWAYGLRNPWRFSFDRATGDLWIADVGQGAFEEIDRLTPEEAPGANLGWNLLEGAHCFSSPSCATEGTVLPVAEYGRDLGTTVIGGYVYRGAEIAALVGWYLYADYGSGRVFATASTATPGGESLVPMVLLETDLLITAFGEGRDGELYLVDAANGTLYRIVAGG
jgi:glucose/arabinose dehydrogenase